VVTERQGAQAMGASAQCAKRQLARDRRISNAPESWNFSEAYMLSIVHAAWTKKWTVLFNAVNTSERRSCPATLASSHGNHHFHRRFPADLGAVFATDCQLLGGTLPVGLEVGDRAGPLPPLTPRGDPSSLGAEKLLEHSFHLPRRLAQASRAIAHEPERTVALDER
jgi:hypothetical protein